MIYCVYAHERARPEREDFYFDGMQRIRVKCVTALCIRDFQFRFSYYLSPAGNEWWDFLADSGRMIVFMFI